MKTILIFLPALFCAAGACAQGTVVFDNNFAVTGVGVLLRARVYAPEPSDPYIEKHGNALAGQPVGDQIYGGPYLAGSDYTCQLWGHAGLNLQESSLELLATTTFRTGGAAGVINGLELPGRSKIISVPNAPLSGSLENPNGEAYFGTFQLRAWYNPSSAYPSVEDAWAAGQPGGKSEVFSPPDALGGTGTPPAPAAPLVGLTSFNIHLVPEPSMAVLGLLGAGGLLLVARRKGIKSKGVIKGS